MTVLDHRFRFVSAAATHVGKVRKLNEDSFLDRADLGLWVVADGMGGHSAGDFASQTIVGMLDSIPFPLDATGFEGDVVSLLNAAHRRLREESARRELRQPIGSTVVALLAHNGDFRCLWAGDSRLYRLRDKTLSQVSRDHSHVQEMVDNGVLSVEEAAAHPSANVITRAVGAYDELILDRTGDRLEPDDIFLLCSDGLNRMVSDAEIESILAHEYIDEAVPIMIDLAVERGASDNVTVVGVQCERMSDDVIAI
ncbi:protein phosphatase 2C domain-containing protein [Inquilinus sp. CAU 1745]|uniref:PP2C family protein-serine/threonine phosphatase n=1 Tax=Inquilinus sp. CAU 1745 TaxID=3140369 RepID=UPI00325A64B2